MFANTKIYPKKRRNGAILAKRRKKETMKENKIIAKMLCIFGWRKRHLSGSRAGQSSWVRARILAEM